MSGIRLYQPEAGPPTVDDLATLLLELNRVLKAIASYGPGHPSRENLLERTFLIWQLELQNSGAIEFARQGSAFCHDELGRVECRGLDDLANAMEVHQVNSFRATPDFDQDAFTRFVILLAIPTANLDQMCEGGFAGRLYESSGPGIEINGLPRKPLEPTPSATTLAPTTSASLVSAEAEAQTTLAAQSSAAGTTQGERLRGCLRELDRCSEGPPYDALIDKILGWSQELWDGGQREEIYRALLVLTAHASESEDGDPARKSKARAALESLVDGPQLDFLVERACECELGGVPATQILLQLGERSTPAVLDALDREPDRVRSTRLASIVLALGEFAVPALIRAIAERSGGRLQLVVRLAGELQSPEMVPTLADVFHDSGPALRKEAGMALVKIGCNEARDALVRGLATDNEELASAAVSCLEVLRDDRATVPLLDALAKAREQKRHRLTKQIDRTLVRLGIRASREQRNRYS